MHILLVSPECDGPWFVWLLRREGHDCDWLLLEPKYRALDGLIPPPLESPPDDPSQYDLIVFDANGEGVLADQCRDLTPTIGSSTLADRLEEDRLFGLELMGSAGIKMPEYEVFDSPEKGIAWLERTHKRCVFKPIGNVADKSTTYVSKNDKDMIAFIERVYTKAKIHSYVLQEVVAGTEVSCEGWFNGSEWVVIDYTLEEKKFMAGGIGPNTGAAGSLIWSPARPTPIFQQGLEHITPFLREHNYVGPIDLNTIVTEGEAYGLEWTPRFGYEGTCNLTRILPVEFGAFLLGVADGSITPLVARSDFAATIRLSVPPYPNAEKSKRRDVVPVEGIDLDRLDAFFLCDVNRPDPYRAELETTGSYNMIGAPIGVGGTIKGAFEECRAAIRRLEVPDLQWRNDVDTCIERRYRTLQQQGWLRSLG